MYLDISNNYRINLLHVYANPFAPHLCPNFGTWNACLGMHISSIPHRSTASVETKVSSTSSDSSSKLWCWACKHRRIPNGCRFPKESVEVIIDHFKRISPTIPELPLCFVFTTAYKEKVEEAYHLRCLHVNDGSVGPRTGCSIRVLSKMEIPPSKRTKANPELKFV